MIKRLILVFAGLGVFAGVGYWLYLYATDPDSAPTVGDFWQTILSYGRRGYARTMTTINTIEDYTGASDSGEDYIALALNIIAPLESFSPKPYSDVGKLAIGYGHDIVPGDGLGPDSVLTESEAWELLRQDVTNRYAPALDYVEVNLTAHQKAALISFIYNVGVAAFQGSTLLRLLNQGNYDGAAAEFDRWNKAGGKVNASLVARRNVEESLFQS